LNNEFNMLRSVEAFLIFCCCSCNCRFTTQTQLLMIISNIWQLWRDCRSWSPPTRRRTRGRRIRGLVLLIMLILDIPITDFLPDSDPGFGSPYCDKSCKSWAAVAVTEGRRRRSLLASSFSCSSI
jgi:hypothetical protein